MSNGTVPISAVPGPRFVKRTTLATRIAAVTVLASTLAVLIAAVVSLRLVRTTEQNSGRAVLRQDATLAVASATANARATRIAIPIKTTELLRAGLQISAVVVQRDGTVTGPQGERTVAAGLVSAAEVATLQSGRAVSAPREVGGVRTYVEGSPLDSGGGVVLYQRVADARAVSGSIWSRLLIALLAGLACAALAGVLLARRLARPLQHAAAAAHRLSTGARDVRLEPEGPAEVAEVAEALNVLTAALSTSEGRQRDFLLSISHELRTPLTAVKGYAEALADGVIAPEAVGPTGQVVLAEAGRLERLVSDLLDLARLGAENFRIDFGWVDVAALVQQAAVVWGDRCAREGVPFHAEIAPGPVMMNSDPTRLRQIIDGLAENALRVTPSGRPIVFALTATPVELVLQVRDGGPGLTEDDCRVAFDRSVLYDRYRGVRRVGTGVGLALVAGLAGRLGGRAEAGHAPEGGASFTVRFPAA
jgi:two-component system OmpR family sensor kinase